MSPVERVPLYDIMEMVAYAKLKGARLLGPGSIGIISPGIAAAGWLGGTPEFARKVFIPGPVGVISRSGGQSATVPWALNRAGLGMTTVVHVGTEPVTGTSMGEILPLFEKDPDTKGVAVFGEIGGPHEEEAADCVRRRAVHEAPRHLRCRGMGARRHALLPCEQHHRKGQRLGKEQGGVTQGSRRTRGRPAR